MAAFRPNRRKDNSAFPVPVVGVAAFLGLAWLLSFALVGEGLPVWAVLVCAAVVGGAIAFAWLLARVNHGGPWHPAQQPGNESSEDQRGQPIAHHERDRFGDVLGWRDADRRESVR